ncbi:hypothetical protein DUI87_23800 [Hirundo rustica rustica]|uniref:Uncharacterized protein n=1 Tax=Hirundo rustica rustica TaxID=333673 RepID=A0A3M0JED7_HIRRU|nr:hypothetical protein DUI87_23800 [Hirundo rustica rustica]
MNSKSKSTERIPKERALATNSADPQQDNHKLPILVEDCRRGVGRQETRLYQLLFEAGYKKGVAAAIIKNSRHSLNILTLLPFLRKEQEDLGVHHSIYGKGTEEAEENSDS